MKTKTAEIRTHGGALATPTDALTQLKRSVLTALLWEDAAYESGSETARRISDLIPQVDANEVVALAIEAREKMQLRHMPLFLISELSKIKGIGTLVADALERVVQRADELSEFMAIYWERGARPDSKKSKNGKHPLAAGVKRGLARAFRKFSAYSLGKYKGDGNPIKLRDVLFLVHGKPQNAEQAETWKKLVEKTLEPPETWEVLLSAGGSKREVFEKLLKEGKLGGLAVLRNLRNMAQAGVDRKLVEARLREGIERALPFRFIAAAKHAPGFEEAIGDAMLLAARELPKLPGRTLFVIDVSGSMRARLSAKSEMSRVDAANGLAILLREVCESATIYATAGNMRHLTKEVPARRGFALSDAVKKLEGELGGGGIFLAQAMDFIKGEQGEEFDRVIVITDEQDCDAARKPATAARLGKANYLVNVANEKHGVVYGDTGWQQVNGWSEQIVTFIKELDATSN